MRWIICQPDSWDHLPDQYKIVRQLAAIPSLVVGFFVESWNCHFGTATADP